MCVPSSNWLVVIEYVPSSPTVALPIVSPDALVITTVEPASPVPSIVGVLSLVISSLLLDPLSLDWVKLIVGVGMPVSISTVMFAELVLPAVSVEVTVRVLSPSGNSLVVTEYVPSSPTVALPIVSPDALVITTVEPASPVPSIVGVLSLVISSLLLDPLSLDWVKLIVGVCMPVSISTVMFAELVLPAVSVEVTVSVLSPSGNSLVVTEYVPSSPTVALPIVSPDALVITTVEPASPVPSIVGVLSLVISSLLLDPLSLDWVKLIVGVGMPVSISTVMFAELVLPAVSVEVTVRVLSPSGNSLVVTEYVPSSPTVALPIVSPDALVITTVEPASPVPSIVGVLSLVISSLLLDPLSLDWVKLIVGVGIPVSISTVMFA